MYPYIDESVKVHFFDDIALFLSIKGNYILNDVEVFMLDKFDGVKSIDELSAEIAEELEIDEIPMVTEKLMEFIDSKPDVITLNEHPKKFTLKSTGLIGKMIPVDIILSLTNKCNLECIHCFKKCSMNNGDFVDYEKLMAALKYLKGKTIGIQLTGGEPMVHPKFFDILDYCKNNFRTTVTSTGTLLNENNIKLLKGVGDVQLSVYSHIPEEHDAVTTVDGSFKRTVESIRLMRREGISVTIATILTRKNMAYMDDIISMAEDLGCTMIRFGVLVPTGRGANLRDEWLLTDEEYTDVKELLKYLGEKYKGRIDVQTWEGDDDDKDVPNKYKALSCGAGIFTWSISEKGNVKACDFIDDCVCSVANIYTDTVENIVEGFDYKGLPQGLIEWNDTLKKENCSVLDQCKKIKEYYIKNCIKK